MSDYKLASINSFQNANDFSAAYWTKSNYLAFGSGSVADATLAPDGTMTADLLVENAVTSAQHPLYRVTGVPSTLPLGTVLEMEVYLKSLAGNRSMDMRCGAPAMFGALPRAMFHPSSGTYTGLSAGAAASITSAGDGWWRCLLRTPPVVSAESVGGTNAILGYLVESGFITYTGDSMSGIYVWGADLRKIVPHNPNYDIKYDSRKIENVHRTRSGAQYRYKWGEFARVKYKVEDLSSAHMTTINSWWSNNAPVRLFDLADTCVVSGGFLVNSSRPIDQYQAPYTDLFNGTIELEGY